MTIMKTVFILFLISLAASAENKVFVDAAFPYRIVCKTEWVQELKNDSLLLLKNSSPGKKTRLHLQKYPIDTGYDYSNKSWSRLRFAVNKEIATNIGQLMWFDSTVNKKLGNYRAFEICAYYSEKSASGTVWWAEYSRWTDHDGFGYLASIIGDTTDIRLNCTTMYKAILDSISISQLTTKSLFPAAKAPRPATRLLPDHMSGWYTVLGKDVQGSGGKSRAIVVKKNAKRLFMR
jgi:hypothetical protein